MMSIVPQRCQRVWIAAGIFAAFGAAAFAGARFVDAFAAGLDGDGSPPRLQIDVREQNLGSVHAGDAVDARFLVKNRGGERLVIREAKGGCGCMKTRHASIVVPPGGETNLDSHLETANLSGSFRLETRYETNDPAQPELRVFVMVDVKPQ
jgi:Protein of unknown function (DUF1573)